ncbi:zinc ribbon domain-containing protein [Lysinibacillus xylanilyticus]|uniref:zinc ribbon domain-containing protein n=1 Tax=Lysinibacillus xylanilyticus TaxID=582475 RepID=UPI003CFC70CA
MFCTYCGSNLSEHAEICLNCGVRNFKVLNYCHNCGNELNPIQDMCTSCGIILRKPPKGTNPLAPALLTFLIPGVGQIINNQVGKGFLCLFIFIMIGVFIFDNLIIGFIIVGLPILIDAYLIGKKCYEGKAVGKWEFF